MATIYEIARQRTRSDMDLAACAERSREIVLNYERAREATPERKAQHAAYDRSEAGKTSMARRGAKYRATEKGKAVARKKSGAYYARHKDDPEFKAKRAKYQRSFRMRHPGYRSGDKHEYNVSYWARKCARRLEGEHVLSIMDLGVVRIHFGVVA